MESKKKKLKTKKQRGITLIALVVTIVVLLILASVSITVVFGDNGILQLAKEAGEKTNEAVQKDKQDVQNLVKDIDDIINPPIDVSTITEIVTENTKAIDKNGNKLIIPAGFKVLADTEDNNVKYADSANPTVEDGIVIVDDTGNEFVWVPVFDETPIFTTYNGKLVGQLYNFGTSENSKYPADKITYSTGGSREPDTVKTCISNQNRKGDEDTANLNIVLEEGEEKTEEKFKEQLQREFDYLIESVNKYKGFYIGRYETGNLKSEKNNIPVVQKGNANTGNVNWYYMYQTSKNISLKNTDERVKNSVTSSMIWESQWDAVMNWFLKNEDTKGYVTNSTGIGWFKNNYATENPKHETGKDIKGENGQVKNRVKNIYDMAGNVWDWTIGAKYSDQRVSLGGSWWEESYGSASSEYGENPYVGVANRGTRSTLIINLPTE